MNYSLAEDDVEEGFILTCQAHPTSANIFIDYDEMQRPLEITNFKQ